jgi:hypothetical protein
VLDGREHGGIIAAVGRHVPEARAVYARLFTAANTNSTASGIIRSLPINNRRDALI